MPERDVRGVVKSFNPHKGYGFVTEQGTDQDIFMHRRCIEDHGMQHVAEGVPVLVRIKEKQSGKQVVKKILAFHP